MHQTRRRLQFIYIEIASRHYRISFNVFEGVSPKAFRKKNRQDLEKILKAIERLQRAMPRANDPTYPLLFDRRFAWGYYAGGPEWTEFLALADKFEEMGLTNFPDILELAHTFIVTAEKLVGTSRDRKHVGLHNEYHSHSCFRQGAIHTPDRKREQAVVKPPAASAARGARRLPRQASR
jgi:hypothetical protein